MARLKKTTEDPKKTQTTEEELEAENVVELEPFDVKGSIDKITEKLAELSHGLTILNSRYLDTNIKAIVQEEMNQGRTVNLGEENNMEIEQLTTSDMYPEAIELAAFMEDVLTVRVFETTSDNDYEIFPISVNDVHQPVVRGADQKIKRKFVEVMARCRDTEYRQKKPGNPAVDVDILHQLKPTTKPMYPFIVIDDPSPNGNAWINKILAEGH